MGKKLFVGGIPWGIKEDDLREAFSKAGTVESVAIIIDRMSGRSKGFGFVEMSSKEEAQAAIEMWNGKEMDDGNRSREIIVNIAKPREER